MLSFTVFKIEEGNTIVFCMHRIFSAVKEREFLQLDLDIRTNANGRNDGGKILTPYSHGTRWITYMFPCPFLTLPSKETLILFK